MTVNQGRILRVVIILAILGIVVSSMSLYHHYDKSESSFCDFGGSFNCDIVNRSIYSTVFDIPVALIGSWDIWCSEHWPRSAAKKQKEKRFCY